jgi:two-component system, OmpR family, sensor histidine kinase VanS
MITQKIQNILKQSGASDTKLKNDYTRLKRKIFLWVLLTPLLAFLIGWVLLAVFIDGVFQDPFADLFVRFSRRVFGLKEWDAIVLYGNIFRDNKLTWVFLGYIIIMFFIFYRALSRFVRYFNEVNSGLDHLLEEDEDEISLSPEMESIGKKLNRIKATLKKRETDAQNAEQRKNDLVVYLAHDIKTPLTSVIGYLSLLEEAPDMPLEQKAKYVKITLEKAFRLEQLINEFFEITRYNLQTILLDKQEINLTYMLLQMSDEFYPLLSQTGKSAVVQAEDSIVIHGDPDKLARVFNNIMKNAIAYGYDNSVIQIDARPLNNNVIISFSNHGRTIPAHKLETIFDKFYRLDDARSSNTGGSGLGLAIAKSIVTSHGGSISAESKDEVTTFTVVLPIY